MDPVVEIVSKSDTDLQFVVRNIDLAVARTLFDESFTVKKMLRLSTKMF
jgi:hypothetical protein